MDFDTPYLAAVLAHAARPGFRLLPLKPGSKAPATARGVHDATSDPAALRARFRRAPWEAGAEKGVGLACGGPERLVAVDIDEKGDSGADSLARAGIELPATFAQDTPSGGRHLLYRWPGDAAMPGNRVSLLPGVDIRSEGGYICIAPTPGYTLHEAPIAEAPPALVALLQAKSPRAPTPSAASPSPPWAPHASPGVRPGAIERARAYLSCCAPAIQGQRGHASLLWAAHALVVGFDLPDPDALRLLWDDYNPRCVPPWDPSDAAQRRDFERKVSEARRNPGVHSFGYLLASSSGAASDVPALATEGAAHAAALLAPAPEESAPAPAVSAPLPAPAGSVPEASASGTPVAPLPAPTPPLPASAGSAPAPSPSQDVPWPAALLDPPGLVGDIARWITATAGCPQPRLSIAAALATCAAVMGRKICTESGARTNLYLLGIAPSGAGKDHPCKCAMRLLRESGAESLLAAEAASDAAIEKMLSTAPCRCMVLDEAGQYLAGASEKVAGVNYARAVTTMLTRLYTSADGLYIGKQKRDGDPVRIDQPCLVLFGVTAPDVLYESLTRAELRNGFLGRLLVFSTDERPAYRRQRAATPPRALLDRLRRWVRYEPPAPDGSGDIEAAATCHPRVLPATAEAAAILASCEAESRADALRCAAAEDPAEYLWVRCGQIAERLALVVAGGCDADAIEAPHAAWGAALARRLVGDFAAVTRARVAEDLRETPKLRVLESIRHAGETGIGKSELLRRHRSYNARRMGELLDDLLEAGDIVAVQSFRHNSPTTLYRIAP